MIEGSRDADKLIQLFRCYKSELEGQSSDIFSDIDRPELDNYHLVRGVEEYAKEDAKRLQLLLKRHGRRQLWSVVRELLETNIFLLLSPNKNAMEYYLRYLFTWSMPGIHEGQILDLMCLFMDWWYRRDSRNRYAFEDPKVIDAARARIEAREGQRDHEYTLQHNPEWFHTDNRWNREWSGNQTDETDDDVTDESEADREDG